jgi:ERCC4-type nuclease
LGRERYFGAKGE